jgi:hypothetical protein
MDQLTTNTEDLLLHHCVLERLSPLELNPCCMVAGSVRVDRMAMSVFHDTLM